MILIQPKHIAAAVGRLDSEGDGRSRRDVPFERSYWVVPGRLLAGYYPGHSDPDRMSQQCRGLVGCGIRSVVSLMEEHEVNLDGLNFPDYTPCLESGGAVARFSRHAIVDMSVPRPEEMRTTLDSIDASLASDEPVYLHCWGGRGRTGTVVGCWLMRHAHASASTVFDLIAALRAGTPDAHLASPETGVQRSFVRTWDDAIVF